VAGKRFIMNRVTQHKSVDIRSSLESDVPVIQQIYADQVVHGTASFEEVPPSVAEMQNRRRSIVELGLPYLVAVVDDAVLGYAYAGRYRTRSAYRHSVENSVYVHESSRGQGIGKQLLNATITACEALGYREMIGIVGDSENRGSIQLHLSCGFEIVGTLSRVGYKHERWLDTVITQRSLNPRDASILSPLDDSA